MPGKYGSLNLDEEEEEEDDDRKKSPHHAHFEKLKESSTRHSQGMDDTTSSNKEDRSSVVADGIPLPLNLAPLLKRLSDSKYDDEDLSDDDILSILFIIRIAEALHR